jgi:hypothetical protein
MPSLDLSEALLEPTFQDCFTVTRRATATNDFGEVVNTNTIFNNVRGVVEPDGDNALLRGIDEQHAGKTLSIITRFRLQTAVTGCQPDLVTWHGSTYVVRVCEDVTGYGGGWIESVCTSQDYTDAPPAPVPSGYAL